MAAGRGGRRTSSGPVLPPVLEEEFNKVLSLIEEQEAAEEFKQFEWNAETSKSTSTFVRNLLTVHHPSHSVKVVIRASEAILEVAEHDEGCAHLAELGTIEAVIDLQKCSDDTIILKNAAGLILALVRTDHDGHPSALREEVGRANMPRFVEAGGLEAIVKLGAMPDPVIRRRALCALCFLVAQPETHPKMAEVGVVQMLATVTEDLSERTDILDRAVDALGGLCFTHVTAAQVAQLGGVANLVQLLRSPDSTRKLRETTFKALVGLAHTPMEEVQYKAAGAMRELAVSDNFKKEIMRFKGIEVLVQLINSGSEQTQGQAASAIRSLALNGFNRMHICTVGGVDALVRRLQESSVRLQTQLVGALWNLTREPRCVARILELDPLERLCWLAESPRDEVRELVVGLVRALCMLDSNTRRRVVGLTKHAILHQDTTLDCNTGGRFMECEIFPWS